MTVTGLVYYSAIVMVKKSLDSNGTYLPFIKRLKSTRVRNVSLPIARKKVLRNDVSHDGSKLFNQLPAEIKSELNLIVFKKKLKDFILSRNESLIKPSQFTNKNFFL